MKRAAVARLVIRANVANIGGVATRLVAIKYISYIWAISDFQFTQTAVNILNILK